MTATANPRPTWSVDLFVPKEVCWALDLGLVCLSPAVTVRKSPCSSAPVRLRCHAVGHSTVRLTLSVRAQIVQRSEFLQVVRDHDLSEATGDGHDF